MVASVSLRLWGEYTKKQEQLEMANAQPPEQKDTLPKTGRVNEMCKEWLVREDGALAYRLQSEEITEHLQGNRYRNAVVREDFPRALDEQIREQQLAEQAAAVYHQMLAEQEEIDNVYAKELAERIEREEKIKRRGLETHLGSIPLHNLPQRPPRTPPDCYNSVYRPDSASYNMNYPSRRQALAMPLPLSNKTTSERLEGVADHYLYTEPYRGPENLIDQFDRIDIAEVGLPLEELTEREIQEQKDAMLARQLQDEEDSSEQSQLNRDRLLAIEAQDKELAKLLQERERQKAKRAKERAKQKALAKKQQQQQQVQEPDLQHHQIMPDDSYSNPVDLLPTPHNTVLVKTSSPQKYAQNDLELMNREESGQTSLDEDINYSFPVDVLPSNARQRNYNTDLLNGMSLYQNERSNGGSEVPRQPVRPNQLDLRGSLNQPVKPRYPDPEFSSESNNGSQVLPSPTSSPQHANIAMVIDPTYNRKSYYHHHHQQQQQQHSTVPYYDTSTSSTVTTSTSSSSPGILLQPQPSDNLEHDEETSPVPPYMPIQGQRRTASLEKKSKKKSKDGCKQQ